MAERERMSTSAMGELLADRVDQAAHRRVRRRRMLTAVLIGLGMLAGFLLAVSRQTPYVATGRLQMFLRSRPSTPLGRLSKQGLANQRELMLGTTFLEDVVSRLSPEDQDKLLGGAKIRPGKHAAAQRAAQVSAAMGGFDVEIEPATLMIVLSFAGDDPQLAAHVVTAAMQAADELGLRLRTERAERMTTTLSARLDELTRKIRAAEASEDAQQESLGRARVSALGGKAANTAAEIAGAGLLNRREMKLARQQAQKKNPNVTALELEEPTPDDLLETLGVALSKTQLSAKLAQSRATLFAALHDKGEDEVIESQTEGEERLKLDQLRLTASDERRKADLLAVTLGPAQPSLLAQQASAASAERELAHADSGLVATAQAAAQLARQREQELQTEFNARKVTASAIAQAQIEAQLPQLDLAVDEDLLAAQTEILRSAQVEAASKAFGFYVVDRPSVPLSRQPRVLRTSVLGGAGLGMALGLLGSLLLYGREFFRWDLAEAEKRTGLGLVAVLPQTRRSGKLGVGGRHTPEVLEAPQGVYAEAMGELVQKILAAAFPTPIVVVTSATPGEGKTTTAANLALLLARQGRRVLLVDADLHRPTMHRRFGLSSAQGLGHVLAGRAELSQVVQQPAGISGMDVLVAGPTPPQPSALLQSGRMEELLENARVVAYDAIVMDAPPVLGSSDSAYLTRWSNVLLFVARWGRVDPRQMQRGGKGVEATAPALSGLVVNSVPEH